LAELTENGGLILRGEVLRPDGSECLSEKTSGPADNAEDLGADMARKLRGRMGPDFF
jgi:hydroxymethylbilane synthase